MDNSRTDHDKQRGPDIPEQSTPYPRPAQEDKTVTETTAEKQDRALAAVQRLLKQVGIRSRRDHKISLGLFTHRVNPAWPDSADLRSWTRRYPPELVVTDSQGKLTATVTIERRSGAYLLVLHGTHDREPVRAHEAEKAAVLITSATAQASTSPDADTGRTT